MAYYNMPEGSTAAYDEWQKNAIKGEQTAEILTELRAAAEAMKEKAEALASMSPDDVSTALLDAIYEVEALLEA